MNARIMRLLLYLSFILVTGCSSSDPSGTNSPSNVSNGNAVIFNPLTGDVPLPNILATAKYIDPLTQDAAGNAVARAANNPMMPPEALNYVNVREAGSTHAVSGVNSPIYIRFSSPVDATTVTSTNVKVFQLTADAAGTENNTLGFTDVSAMFTYSYTPGSMDLFLYPDFPLSPATRYLYVVTNKVLDAASGKPVISSTYFDILKSKYTLVGPFAGLEALRQDTLIDPTKVQDNTTNPIKFSGYAKVMDDLIKKSATTTITSRDEIAIMGRFNTTVAGYVPKVKTGNAAADFVVSNLIPVESALRAFALGVTPPPPFPVQGGLTGKTWLTTGLNTATDTTPAGLTRDQQWALITSSSGVPASVGSVKTGTINSAQLSIDPVVVKANQSNMVIPNATATENKYAGVLTPYYDTSNNLTGYYHRASTVPFVLITPTTQVSPPKVVIFQHGITRSKEDVAQVAGALTAKGYSVVAIDLPFHGALADASSVTGTDWSSDFLAVGYPLATRSNTQQAAFNLNRLEFSLRFNGFNGLLGVAAAPTNISYVGLSLGSIVGAYYLAGNATLNTTDPTKPLYSSTTLSTDMKGFLSVPGGRLAYLIKNSPSFGPIVNAKLAAAGLAAGTANYNNFFLVTQSIVDSVDPATITTALVPGLPSRLSGRIAIQEVIGDHVIPNTNTRYFAKAMGGRSILPPTLAYDMATGFNQISYTDNSIIDQFMYSSGNMAKKAIPGVTATEGYFQFNQPDIHHSFLISPLKEGGTSPADATANSVKNYGYAQAQMASFISGGGIIDPSTAGSPGKIVMRASEASTNSDAIFPISLTVFGR